MTTRAEQARAEQAARGARTVGRASFFTRLACLTCVTCLACGPSKPAEDPSKEAAAKEEETPKWDSSSETASNPRPASGGSEGGAGSSAGAGSGGAAGDSGGASASSSHGFSPAPSTSRKMDIYDKEETEVVLKRAARQVKQNCGLATDDEGKRVGPWGKAQVSVVLGHNGHSKGATIPAPYEGKPAGKCAVQAFSNLTFPPWSGPDTTVEWEVEIVAPK